ncbi:alginate O-acetyltransferase AlgX-related protein [Sciscionella sediminilitoris]|uniref:alginate O-acetyltransferase AlgX-related protein n=1 Tax=Sciscionella sediminilitoris TaxID=1445613 RepID=UPI0012E12BE1|nr:hypothetical protein [Sciscionella sp. SE31]
MSRRRPVHGAPDETTVPIAVYESWLPPKHPLHRPRHGRTQRVSLICAVAFLLLPAIAYAIGIRPTEFENHKLAALPGPDRGFGMFTGLDKWATDNLPLREGGVRAEDAISQGIFGELPPKGEGSGGSPFGPSTGGASSVTPEAEVAAKRNQYPEVIRGKDGWLFYGMDVSMKCVTVRSMNDVIASVARFEKILRDSGRTPVVLVPPDKSTILNQYMPDQYAGKKCMTGYRDKFWPKIEKQDHILDVRKTLTDLRKVDPDEIYFKNDTHWEDMSAIAALRAVCERIQPGVSRTWKADKVTSTTRTGDLARLLGSDQTEPWPQYRLSPDGVSGGTPEQPTSLRSVTTVRNQPAKGMIDEPAVVLGDSFSLPLDKYASNIFSNVSFGAYDDMDGGLTQIQNMIVNSKVVVLEMLERGMATGEAPLLRPKQLDKLEQMLKQHPK